MSVAASIVAFCAVACQALAFAVADGGLSLLQLHAARFGGSSSVSDQAFDENGTASSSGNHSNYITSAIPLGNGSVLDHLPSSSRGMVTVYIQFGKTGSSSIRNVLEYRAERHGWPIVDEEATCKKHGVDGPACAARKLAECARAESQGLPCGKRLCLNVDVPQNPSDGGPLPDCSDQPTGSVVQSTYPGHCEALHDTRPCQYVTLLREPVARTVSAYNYWCLDCLDHIGQKGIFCQDGYGCPNNMTISDWAKRHGNDYTRRLATRAGREHLSDGFYSDDGFLSGDALTEEDFEVALKFMQADNTLALAIEEFSGSGHGQRSGLRRLAKFLGDGTVLDSNLKGVIQENQHEHSYVPTHAETQELREILDFDVRLYEAALAA